MFVLFDLYGLGKPLLYESLDDALLSQESCSDHGLDGVWLLSKCSNNGLDGVGVWCEPSALALACEGHLWSASFVF